MSETRLWSMPTGEFARTKPSPIGPTERATVARPSVYFIVRFFVGASPGQSRDSGFKPRAFSVDATFLATYRFDSAKPNFFDFARQILA